MTKENRSDPRIAELTKLKDSQWRGVILNKLNKDIGRLEKKIDKNIFKDNEKKYTHWQHEAKRKEGIILIRDYANDLEEESVKELVGTEWWGILQEDTNQAFDNITLMIRSQVQAGYNEPHYTDVDLDKIELAYLNRLKGLPEHLINEYTKIEDADPEELELTNKLLEEAEIQEVG